MVNIFILEDFVRSTTITNKLCHPPKDKARGVVPLHGPRPPAVAPALAAPSPAAPAPIPATTAALAAIAAATTPPAAHLLHQKRPQTHPGHQADQLGVEPSYLVL